MLCKIVQSVLTYLYKFVAQIKRIETLPSTLEHINDDWTDKNEI
jgi:hypothetical protein